MQIGNILVGYTTQDRPYKVENYPWGFRLKTTIHYWIESQPGKGDRLCSYTIDPKNGRACKPKYSTYSVFMYLYIDPETGHVKWESIDSYHIEEFPAKFERILNKIGEIHISDVQKANLRQNHYAHVKISGGYQVARYSEEKKPEFIQWYKDTLKHIATCEFKYLVNYPERPEEDNPEGEIKMKVTTYEPK